MSFNAEFHLSQAMLVCEHLELYEKAAIPNKAELIDLYRDAEKELKRVYNHLVKWHKGSGYDELKHDLIILRRAYDDEYARLRKQRHCCFIEA